MSSTSDLHLTAFLFKKISMAKDAYYFSHDSNSKDDPKCVLLIEQLGLEGYGIFWVFIETLREQPQYKYPLALIPAIARRFNTTSEKAKTVVLNYGLFTITEDEMFLSESLIERMQYLENKREKASIAGKISAQKRQQTLNDRSTDVEQTFNDRSTDVEQTLNDRSTSKVKESKVNLIKENKRSLEERRFGFKNELSNFVNEFSKDTCNDFYRYWTETNEKEKMKYEFEKTFEINKRLVTWKSREKPKQTTVQNQTDKFLENRLNGSSYD